MNLYRQSISLKSYISNENINARCSVSTLNSKDCILYATFCAQEKISISNWIKKRVLSNKLQESSGTELFNWKQNRLL